jgi:hypothetical protein
MLHMSISIAMNTTRCTHLEHNNMKTLRVLALLFVTFISAITLTTNSYAQSIEQLRGGWISDIDGVRHIFYIVLRNNQVSGVYCSHCDNPDQLAFIDDGKLDSSGLHFQLYYTPTGAAAFQETASGKLQGSELVMQLQRDGNSRELRLHRTLPQKPNPIADFTPNRPPSPAPRTLPGPAETVTMGKVAGLWLWGTGPTKQWFIFKRHKDGLRGMVCGPCDNAPDMAPLEQISINGTTLHFEIVHEDNGGDYPKHGPHSNVTDAQIARNELLMNVVGSFQPAGTKPIEMTLLGPVRFQQP